MSNSLTPETVAAAIKATEYKYFGDYEMSDDQREAVDVLVEVARQVYTPPASDAAVPVGQYEARFVAGGAPTDCVDYGVVSLAKGVEVCRVWQEDDARLIADLLNAAAAGPPPMTDHSPDHAGRAREVAHALLHSEGEQIVRDMATHVGDEVHGVLKRHGMMMRTTAGTIAMGVLASLQMLAETVEFARKSMDGDAADEEAIASAALCLFADEATQTLPALAAALRGRDAVREQQTRECQSVWRCAVGDFVGAMDVLKNRWEKSRRKHEREAGAALAGVLNLAWAARDPAASNYSEAAANGKKLVERVRASLHDDTVRGCRGVVFALADAHPAKDTDDGE